MYKSNIYPKLVLLVSFMVLGFTSAFAQLEMKLQLMDDDTWGVYVTPNGVTPDSTTITGSGQVTVVMPAGFSYGGLTSVSGLWNANATVVSPAEDVTRQYVSFGLVQAEPNYPIYYTAGVETLLFTFDRNEPCPDTMYLIDCGTPVETDPFCPPNSMNSNPGNDLSVIEFSGGVTYYNYSDNYAPSAWSCHDCDDDGILNALEDSNGNGVFDFGIDTSDLCDPCDPYHIQTATLDFVDGFDAICGGDIVDTAELVVTIEGPWPPYSVVLNNSLTGDTTYTNYNSGDTIRIVPDTTAIYTITTVIDSMGCAIDPDSIFGSIGIDVHGPISITADPVAVTECSEDFVTFSATPLNSGLSGTITQKWQISTDGGANYSDINDGLIYDGTDSTTVTINPIAGLHGYYFRMKIWTDVCDTVYSAGALLSVEGPITVTASPADITVCDGAVATFTGAGNNANAPTGSLQYNWQVDTGSGWSDISNGAIPEGATYSNVDATTLTITDADVLMDGWQYRMAIFTDYCSRIFTEPAILDIEGPLVFTLHPADVSNCAGNEVFFWYTFENDGLGIVDYQWQENDGSGFVDLVNGGAYNNTNGIEEGASGGDTLAITNVIGLDGNTYRVCINTSTCGQICSNPATLDVSGNVEFTTQPSQEEIRTCAGNDTTIVVCASIPQGNFYFHWEYSTDNGATWDSLQIGADPNYSSSTNGALQTTACETLTINDVTGLEYYWYRAVAVATDCNSVVSEEARLVVEGPFSVTTQPEPDTICAGNPVFFSAEIANAGDSTAIMEYQWQYSFDNINWTDCTEPTYGGVTGTTLTIPDAGGLHGTYYRMAVTASDCGFVYTNSARLVVEGPINVTLHPNDVTLCSDDGTSLTSTATIDNSGTLQYQWQFSTDGGVNWADVDGVVDGGRYSNWNTTTLDISNASVLYSRCYRLAFYTDLCSRAYSNLACLTVQGPLAIDIDPTDQTECSDDPVTFTVDVSNSSLDVTNDLYIVYQWQENDGSGWANLADGLLPTGDGVNGVNTDTLSVIETAGRDNYQYRVLVWSEFCDTLTSAAATLFLEGPLTWTLMPEDTTECEGYGVSFSAQANNAGLAPLSYQWEISDDNGVTYTNLANGGDYTISGATMTTITFDTVGYDLHGDRIRLKAWTLNCDTIYSDYAQFEVHGELAFVTHPSDTTACSGDPVCFEVEASNAGAGTIQYRWQYSVNGGLNWINVINGSLNSGANTNFYCISDIATNDSILYRCRINTSECDFVYSNPALLVEEGPITFTDHPEDITQCSAEAVVFDGLAAISAGNSGTISYQWQASSDGVSYANIANGGSNGYSGVTTPTLTISNVTGGVGGISGWHFRLRANTGACNDVYSFSAVLTIEGPLSVSLQPVQAQACDDAEALFLSGISNPADPAGLQTDYQWQILMPSGSWENLTNGDTWNGTNIIGGANSDTLLITPLSGLNGAYVRMKGWTGTCDTLTTDSALIAVEGPLTYTDQPDDVELCSTGSTQFTVAVNNATGVGTIAYQWEYSVDGNIGNWVDIVSPTQIAGNIFSGYNTNQLTLSNSAGMYNYKFRCKVSTGECGFEYSQLAQLFVEGPITIDPQPADTTICSNIDHIIDTEISIPASSSSALTFQWQVSTDAGVTWTNINDGDFTGVNNSYNGDATPQGQYFGTTSEDLIISLAEGMDGFMFRNHIQTSNCDTFSYEMTLTVRDACLAGVCDFDLDGLINDVDFDDDNDQLNDTSEVYLTDNNLIDAWNYLELDAQNGDTPFDAVTPRYISYSRCDTDSDNDLIQDNQEDPDGDEISNGEEHDGDGIFDGDPLDPCSPILGPTCIGIQLAIDVYLQGGNIFNTSNAYDMRDELRQIDNMGDDFIKEFPPIEPYTDIVDDLNISNIDTPFVHVGDGGLEEIDGGGASILSISTQDAIVDWVFVELRSSTNLDSVITTRAALLQADGDVVDMDGASDLSFINAPAGPYYVVVRHRNHLGIMSAEAMDLSPIVTEVDFTDPSTPTYGDNGQINIGGTMYLWGGDFNSNDRVVYQGPFNDINYLFSLVVGDQVDRFLDPASATYDPGYGTPIANWITRGYEQSDIDINAMSIYQGPGNDRQLMLFNTTLSHPLNDGHIANFVIEGILP